MRHNGSKWVIVERSGGFWMVIQGEKKRKKINEVRHLLERGHDTCVPHQRKCDQKSEVLSCNLDQNIAVTENQTY